MFRLLAWVSVLALAALPWVALRAPWLAPAVAVAGMVTATPWRRRAVADPEGSLVEGLSAALAIWAVEGEAVLAWLALAAAVALAGRVVQRRAVPRPDGADLIALVGWGGASVVRPELVTGPAGWLAPAVLLLAARRLALPSRRVSGRPGIGPPSGEVRGDLVLEDLVAADGAGLTALPPLGLRLAPGQSAALVCDEPSRLEPLAMVVAGRREPAGGRLLLDGRPARGELPVAVVARGEPFVPGSLEENLAVLCGEGLTPAGLLAARESCGLELVERELAGRELDREGEPLGLFSRMLVLAARVMVSGYRVVVVVDPVPWVEKDRAELWRRAVVRASVGRTALWITADRELARRADRRVLFRSGIWQEVGG